MVHYQKQDDAFQTVQMSARRRTGKKGASRKSYAKMEEKKKKIL